MVRGDQQHHIVALALFHCIDPGADLGGKLLGPRSERAGAGKVASLYRCAGSAAQFGGLIIQLTDLAPRRGRNIRSHSQRYSVSPRRISSLNPDLNPCA
jgi:hypothetical protein